MKDKLFRKGIAVIVICFMMLVSHPIVFGIEEDIKPETTEYIFEGFHHVYITIGTSRGLSFGFPFHIGRFWWTPFDNLDVGAESDLVLKVDGKLMEVELEYPFLITLENFIGFAPSLYELMSWTEPSSLEVHGIVYGMRIAN